LDSALTFNSPVTHLGHILRSDLLDDDDIAAVTWDMCRKANCILHTCDPVVKMEFLPFSLWVWSLEDIISSGPFT